jgi:hypothetical protein
MVQGDSTFPTVASAELLIHTRERVELKVSCRKLVVERASALGRVEQNY